MAAVQQILRAGGGGILKDGFYAELLKRGIQRCAGDFSAVKRDVIAVGEILGVDLRAVAARSAFGGHDNRRRGGRCGLFHGRGRLLYGGCGFLCGCGGSGCSAGCEGQQHQQRQKDGQNSFHVVNSFLSGIWYLG